MKDKIVLVHKGALGDFLQAWPSIFSIKKQFPDKDIFWAGKDEYFFFLEPIKIKRLDPKLRLEIDKIYTSLIWPEKLKDFFVVWFGLLTPPTEVDFPNLFWVQGIKKDLYVPPYKLYLQGIKKINVLFYPNWHEEWIKIFNPSESVVNKNRVLIFPGSGNPKRQWELKKFLKLARWIEEEINIKVCFILGPIEIEQNVEVKNFEHKRLTQLKELIDVLKRAKLVIGNDSGPLHLSAYMNIPTIAIFGPSSPKQWAPYKAEIVYKKVKCSPCSQIGKVMCSEPICLKNIRVEDVKSKVIEIFKKLKQGRS